MSKIEILAPVGSEEMLRAAVLAGRMRSTWAFRASMPAPEPAILTPAA